MYPLMTGFVAGAFVLSSLYHVFGQKDLKDLAKFSLVFSFALLLVAPMPLLFHLLQPQRNHHVFMTPHFTSAIAAFGLVFSLYAALVAYEIWFVYRKHFVETALSLSKKADKTLAEKAQYFINNLLTLGAYNITEEAVRKDEKAVKLLAAIGIPIACFLHGYAGFIFGSVKANALWMSPLMPVIFIMSAVVSGIALCMLTYIVIMEYKKFKAVMAKGRGDESVLLIKGAEMEVISKASRYLMSFLVAAISLEILDLIFRGYTAMKSWDILRSVMYGKDFVNIFILQYGIGNLLPFLILILPGRNLRRVTVATILILFGVFMMRWNVVIGGQAFSLSFSGFMHYHLPIVPHSLETFKEGLGGALMVIATPYLLFYFINKFVPSLGSSK